MFEPRYHDGHMGALDTTINIPLLGPVNLDPTASPYWSQEKAAATQVLGPGQPAGTTMVSASDMAAHQSHQVSGNTVLVLALAGLGAFLLLK